jgi:hypothetical protein
MPKYENPTNPGRPEQTKPPLDQDGQTLVAALTAAILAAHGQRPAPHPKAEAAERQYALIKAVLETHSEEAAQLADQKS